MLEGSEEWKSLRCKRRALPAKETLAAAGHHPTPLTAGGLTKLELNVCRAQLDQSSLIAADCCLVPYALCLMPDA
jgi:hypothetical protein